MSSTTTTKKKIKKRVKKDKKDNKNEYKQYDKSNKTKKHKKAGADVTKQQISNEAQRIYNELRRYGFSNRVAQNTKRDAYKYSKVPTYGYRPADSPQHIFQSQQNKAAMYDYNKQETQKVLDHNASMNAEQREHNAKINDMKRAAELKEFKEKHKYEQQQLQKEYKQRKHMAKINRKTQLLQERKANQKTEEAYNKELLKYNMDVVSYAGSYLTDENGNYILDEHGRPKFRNEAAEKLCKEYGFVVLYSQQQRLKAQQALELAKFEHHINMEQDKIKQDIDKAQANAKAINDPTLAKKRKELAEQQRLLNEAQSNAKINKETRKLEQQINEYKHKTQLLNATNSEENKQKQQELYDKQAEYATTKQQISQEKQINEIKRKIAIQQKTHEQQVAHDKAMEEQVQQLIDINVAIKTYEQEQRIIHKQRENDAMQGRVSLLQQQEIEAEDRKRELQQQINDRNTALATQREVIQGYNSKIENYNAQTHQLHDYLTKTHEQMRPRLTQRENEYISSQTSDDAKMRAMNEVIADRYAKRQAYATKTKEILDSAPQVLANDAKLVKARIAVQQAQQYYKEKGDQIQPGDIQDYETITINTIPTPEMIEANFEN